MKKKMLSFVGVAALSFAALVPNDAVAASHNFALPIGSCVPTFGGAAAYNWEGFENTSTTTGLILECGVPFTYRDSSRLTTELVEVIDNSTTGQVICAVDAFDLGGTSYFTGAPQSSTNSFTGLKTFSWTVPSPLASLTMHALCILPTKQGTVGSELVGLLAAG